MNLPPSVEVEAISESLNRSLRRGLNADDRWFEYSSRWSVDALPRAADRA